MIKKLKLAKQPPILVGLLIIGLCLLSLAGILSSRIKRLTEDNLKALSTLNQTLPDFNQQTLGKLKQELKDLEAQLLGLTYLFDPPEKGLKKDYDPSIYFVEELGKINQSLKLKAENKQINFTDLGFKEKLPEEKEARYLLRQLYCLEEVVSRGMDSGVSFNVIAPQPVEDSGVLAGMKVTKTRIELTAVAAGLIEFIIQLSEVVPLSSLESLLLKSQDSSFQVDMTLSHAIIEADWKDKGIPFHPLDIKEVFLGQEKFTHILRGNNPFSVANLKESTALLIPVAGPEPKLLPRFFYRGKAVLRAKEVAVIEDTLKQETVFLALQEKIGNFILKELKASQVILKNINNEQEIIIKREE